MLKLVRATMIGLIVTLMIGCVKQPAPRREVNFTHRITYPGETLALISSWYTGSANNWQSLAAANPGLDPKRLRMGMIVNIPEYLVVRREMLPKKLVGSAGRRAPVAPDNSEPEVASEEVAVEQAAEAAEQAALEAAEESPAEVETAPAVDEEVAEEDSIPTENDLVEDTAAVANETTPVADETAAVAEVSPTEAVAEEIADPVAPEEAAEVVASPAPPAEQKAGTIKSRDELWKELLEE